MNEKEWKMQKVQTVLLAVIAAAVIGLLFSPEPRQVAQRPCVVVVNDTQAIVDAIEAAHPTPTPYKVGYTGGTAPKYKAKPLTTNVMAGC